MKMKDSNSVKFLTLVRLLYNRMQRLSLRTSQVAYQAGAYPSFCSMKLLRVLILYSPLDGMLVHHCVTSSRKFATTHLYTWLKRGTVRVKCLAQEHNTMSLVWAQTQTSVLDLEKSTLTIRQMCLPQS